MSSGALELSVLSCIVPDALFAPFVAATIFSVLSSMAPVSVSRVRFLGLLSDMLLMRVTHLDVWLACKKDLQLREQKVLVLRTAVCESGLSLLH